jgi:hypothetical protein
MKAYSPEDYWIGMGRNPGEQFGRSHLYHIETELPMCGYGWNRNDGHGYSIFRGHTGSKGLCKICQKRAAKGLPGVEEWPHKTKWI